MSLAPVAGRGPMTRRSDPDAWPDVLLQLAQSASRQAAVASALEGLCRLSGSDLAVAHATWAGVAWLSARTRDAEVDIACADSVLLTTPALPQAERSGSAQDAGRALGLQLPELMQAWAWTPIVSPGPEGPTIGWLSMLSRDAEPFDPRPLRALHALAAQLGLALENLRRGQHLDVSEARYKTLVEQLPAVTYFRAIDKPGIASYVSPQIAPMFGYTQEQWLANPGLWYERLHPDDRARVSGELVTRSDPTALAQGQISIEYRILHRDGQVLWVRNHSLAVTDAQGKPEFVLGVIFDISQDKEREASLLRTQDDLRASQRMDAIGRLAGGVAHDFNNLLTAIKAYCEILLQSIPPGTPALDDVEEIRKAADRAAALTHQLLAFSRRQRLAPKVIDLDAVVRDMASMLRRLIGEDIDLVIETDAGTSLGLASSGTVRADLTQIEQVVLNLCVNARDSMPDGGRLTMRTTVLEVDAELAALHVGMKAGPHVLLAVADTGSGMDLETMQHLFEPFFTTKEDGKGTGLGLSTVYGIVTQSQGHILVDSLPGQGTTFRIYLPQADAELQVALPLPLSGTPKLGTEVVLLAEDEPLVRGLVLRVLRRYGYTVLEAHDGQQALELCQMHPGRIDLLLTDVVMPRMSGPDLARQAVAQRPDLKVLFMSGYVDRALDSKAVVEANNAFLAKPFTPAQLALKVREVLGECDGK